MHTSWKGHVREVAFRQLRTGLFLVRHRGQFRRLYLVPLVSPLASVAAMQNREFLYRYNSARNNAITFGHFL